MATQRSASYTNEEDMHLCHIYLDVSLNPILGINQSSDYFWSRVELEDNSSKPVFLTQVRNKRSLQCRMQLIFKAVGKLRGCVRQIENMNPSGASEQDILIRAKILLAEDKSYKKGFRFNHVWPILKDIEKFTDNGNVAEVLRRQTGKFVSSELETPTSESPQSMSPGLSSFSLNINDEDIGGSSAKRPIGVKKAKLKRKNDEEVSTIIETIKEENRRFAEIFKQGSSDRAQNYEIQKKKLALAEYREDNKILFKDLNSITDPSLREFFQNEQLRVMQKRAQQHGQGSQNTSNSVDQYLDNLRGSGTNLPDY
ncbi:hypothetical protein UlMin_005003 [Ulmus minor]